MLHITAGLIVMGISVLGILICLVALAASKRIFQEQRKKLLEQIEEE